MGNQEFLINIDKWMQVRDIFFPYVGKNNHLIGHAHKIMFLENGKKTWLNEDSWKKDIRYKNETLVTNSVLTNVELGVELNFEDNVHCETNIFIRKITVKNLENKKRKISLYFSQDFHLYSDGIGDTALYNIQKEAIIHYKKSVYFLIGVCDKNNKSIIEDYSVGEHINLDEKLNNNAIAQGNVNSAIRVEIDLDEKGEFEFCYYLAAGKNFDEVFSIQKEFLENGYKTFLDHAIICQRGWVESCKVDLSKVEPEVAELYKRSLLIMKTQIDKRGAIIAANDSDNMQFNRDTYSYMWPRDGALVAITLIKAGYYEIGKKFFEFCNDVLYEEGCLLHKYNPDKTLGSSWHPWVYKNDFSLPIQEDETALVLHALWIYYEHTKDIAFLKKNYKKFIKPMGDFLVKYSYENGLPKESYDLWEERRGIFTFTTSAVLSGLIAADKIGHLVEDKIFCESCNKGFEKIKNSMIKYLYNDEKKYFRRGVVLENDSVEYDEALDSSIYSIFEFGVFDVNDEKVKNTMQKVKDWLWVKTKIGGVARYYNDYYFRKSDNLDLIPGNPWFICTLWYAKYIIAKANSLEDLKEAMDLIYWVKNHALNTGVLAEQIHPLTGEPLSVSPLTWSHSEFVDTITNYINKKIELEKKNRE